MTNTTFLKTQQGFTLLELIVVIIVLGILAIGIYISWPGVTINLSAQANQILNDIRYTQSLSMTRGVRYQIVFSGSSYQIQKSTGTPIILALGNTTATLTNGVTFGIFVNLPSNLIMFNGKGVPYISTSTPLVSTGSLALNGGGSTKVITIAPGTGWVTVS